MHQLTEPETAEQVKAHLEDCPACRELEAEMRTQIPVEKAPKRSLGFLRQVKRTRLLAALLTVLQSTRSHGHRRPAGHGAPALLPAPGLTDREKTPHRLQAMRCFVV